MKQKEQFLSELLMMKQSTLETFTKETTIKHTGCPGNAGSISKRILLKA